MLSDGMQLWRELGQALNLPKHMTRLVLRFEIGQVCTADCTFYPEQSDGAMDLASISKRYELHVRKEPLGGEVDKTA